MLNWLIPLQIWHWLIFAVLLIIVEIILPTTFMLWMAISAGVVGVILLFSPTLNWEVQFLIFAFVSVISVFLGRTYVQTFYKSTDNPTLNRRGEQYINKTFVLDSPMENGKGKIRIDDTLWQITGTDCPAGTRVIVTRLEGAALCVEPIYTSQ
ncbi:MAG: NfeD family protein [Gammaproteobacteria bacterium]|nr:NfeD family protein [Gammaproteobacteria bacterium]